MKLIDTIVHKILVFEKEPQRIGLSQLKQVERSDNSQTPSLNKKDVKLSDLMRRAV